MLTRLLRKNTSPARIAGFILSNFLGLAIVLGSLQFYLDARSIWESDESFIHSDYLVVNRCVTSGNTLSGAAATFTQADIEEIGRQPWVRRVAPFASADYRVFASIDHGNRGMSTSMFFESIPDSFVDVPVSQWAWREGSEEVPLIISRDYLTLYNFGFASSAGLPQLSEGLMSGIPISLRLSDDSGEQSMTLRGRVAGFSNRLNTILVPEAFMQWSNSRLGTRAKDPSRVIIEVNSPGDTAIADFIDSHDYEIAGDKKNSQASFLLNVIAGIVLAIGVVITLLSFFILLLSISLLMEKNRDKMHSLLMLGYDTGAVGAPYSRIVVISSIAAWALATCVPFLLRLRYLTPLEGLGAESASLLPMLLTGIGITILVILFNLLSIRRKVRSSWRTK